MSLNRTKERRVAAFELATMAATSDDNKFRIVAEGGYVFIFQLPIKNYYTVMFLNMHIFNK